MKNKRSPAMLALVLGAMTITTLDPTPAAAADPAPSNRAGDPALARDLSKQGYELFLANKPEEAIPLLTRSQELSPDPRTLVNLARCEEKLGRLGSALEHLTAARDLARDRRLTDMSSQIEALVTAVEARLARVVLRLEPGSPANTVVRRGGIEVPPHSFDKGVPADPGEQVFEVSAPGRAARVFRVTVAESERRTLDIAPGPPLPPSKNVPPAATPSSPKEPREPSSSSSKTLGVIGMGVGGAAVVTGLVFGLIAINGKSSAEAAGCSGTRCPDAASASTRDDAKTSGVVSTVLVSAGAFVAAAGLVVFLVAPSSRSDGNFSPKTRSTASASSYHPLTWHF